MSTMNIIEISEKSDDALYPSSELQGLNIKYNNTSDPVVAKLSEIACRESQEKKDKLKLNEAASAFTTIFTCMLCVAISVVIITKLLEDGDRTKLYDTLFENSSSPKIYENQQRPKSLMPVLLKYSDPKFRAQITTTTESVVGLNNSVTEIPVNNETSTLQTSELNVNATTQDTMNFIPTVEPLMTTSSSDNLNMNKPYILSYFLIVLLNFKF